ncbi:protein adenylyltransferase SelO [Paucibacter sp. DJ2R-2]|uniref:protein adenylyltransferase SelO n=1 Tax=Paucibacter sp. DJ2R-2 TaxID=2893558 RepID=UPI0021E41805|nr:YdiU family protein [Paucibacter sp. DJ2R-2]MCV2421510.1 YdiU family protein [Paucibacter sp. DJ4R-1]MCV2438215.1 YdiU family protein [Paucibacter sp. DJ2R-2]
MPAPDLVSPANSPRDAELFSANQAGRVPPPEVWLNRFAALGPAFHTELPPQGLPQPVWVAQSTASAAELGWPEDWWQREDWNALEVLSGNAAWPGMRTLASVYSGHQFGVWAGQLGDGRAHLLGEIATPGGSLELQLKGAGLTPYSRRGDGRAVLRSSIREFLCSEAMHALGIPSTRALALTASSLPVRRETLETAAIVTRVAPSFLRFGHFEHFSHRQQHQELHQLADHFIDLHAPECRAASEPYLALLERVARQTGALLAQWQAVGFCHGVMNTDNMSMLGLTIDYGPFGFLDGFNPGHICNHSDHQGRYAFARQPSMAFWNLHALAQALLPLIQNEGEDPEAASERALDAIEPYKQAFSDHFIALMRAKLGLLSEQTEDTALIDDWLRLLAATQVDYTIAHRRLSRFGLHDDTGALRDLFLDRDAFDAWAQRYRQRLQTEASQDGARQAAMRAVNPAVVLRNHLAEGAIRAAQAGDFSETQRLLQVLQRPFDDPKQASDAAFPPDWAQTLEVSCSS